MPPLALAVRHSTMLEVFNLGVVRRSAEIQRKRPRSLKGDDDENQVRGVVAVSVALDCKGPRHSLGDCGIFGCGFGEGGDAFDVRCSVVGREN